jgi:hypothetical protein
MICDYETRLLIPDKNLAGRFLTTNYIERNVEKQAAIGPVEYNEISQ